MHFCVLRKLTVKVSLVLPGLGVSSGRPVVSCLTCSSMALRENVREQQSSALLLESFKCLTITSIYSYLERMQQSRASWGTPAGDRNLTSSSRHKLLLGLLARSSQPLLFDG